MSSDVDTLMEMGFPKNRAEKALHKTQYKSVQVAMDWLFAHSEDPDIDDPFELPKGQTLGQASTTEATEAEPQSEGAPASTPDDQKEEPQVAKSLKCEDCGKLLKSPEAAELHAARSGHANFSESTEEVKPLTEEEKKQQMEMLQERMKQKRIEKEAQDRKEQIAREKMRRVHGKEMITAKQRHDELEMQKIMEQRKREKDEEKKAKQRVREQIEKDKRDRAVKFGKASPQTSSETASAPAASPAPAAAATSPAAQKEYNQARIQIRLTNGQALTQTFGVKEPLSAVRLYTQMNRMDGDGDITFMTTFPRKVFSDADMDAPLESLGLVPSAVLIVTKQQ